MKPERIEELRRLVRELWTEHLIGGGITCSDCISDCLDEIERLQAIIEQANGVAFPYAEMMQKVRGEK